MNPLKSRQLGLARHLDDQETPLAGAKDSVWGGSGHPGWTQLLPREGRLFKGGALPQTWPQRRTPDSRMPAGLSLCTRSSQKGCPIAGANGTLSTKEGGGRPAMGPGASAASIHQGTLKNGVKRHEGSVRCKHGRFHVSLGTPPEKLRHAMNMWLPDPADVRTVRR